MFFHIIVCCCIIFLTKLHYVNMYSSIFKARVFLSLVKQNLSTLFTI